MPLPRILVVDDHPIVLSGLRLLIAADPRFALCGEARDGVAARASAETLQPDLIVTDLVIGGIDGISLIEELVAAAPAARIIAYSSHDERAWGSRVIRAGGHGFVSKAQPLEAVTAAAEIVLNGRLYLKAGTDRPDLAAGPLAVLSSREMQVLRLIGRGVGLQTLGHELGLSVKTVGTYRERLKTKLGLESVRMLERFAADHVLPGGPSGSTEA